jgi:uncharacterized protein (TIGR02145 family)
MHTMNKSPISKSCALLFFGALIALIACNKDDENISTYGCLDGTCITQKDGPFASKSECEAQCVPAGGGSGQVTDIDGNTYSTVQIGNQIWMAENLRVATYNDGVSIAEVTGNNLWYNTSNGAWSFYENDSSFNTIYGKLYNWYAVNTGKLCPIGWHIPTTVDWQELIDFLGGETVAGGKMKSTTGWSAPNTGATNESGFAGYPGGQRWFSSGIFTDILDMGGWWSATPNARNGYYDRLILFQFSTSADLYYIRPTAGLSCRCIKS